MPNTGATTLRTLGVGGAFSRRYGTTCAMLTLSSGERWLIDCGRQAPDQLHDAGITWHDLAGQIITHVHGDHVFGLEDFAFGRFYESRGDVASIVSGGPQPDLVVHSAVREEVWSTLYASLRYHKLGDNPTAGTLNTYFNVCDPVAVEPPADNEWNHSESFVAGGTRITARESEHVPGKPSCSLEISIEAEGDRMAWWSGDCTVDADYLASIEARTSIFFHDCTFVEYPGQVHGAFSLLRTLPESIRHKMVLMHHEDNIESHRAEAEALGFRVAMPGDTWDLLTGQRA
ncbi:MAG: MBL fold metallo-hydrolase [Nannocystaceae bacterium]